MRFLLYFFILTLLYCKQGWARDSYSPIISDHDICQIDKISYLANNIRSSQKPGENCAGFWPKDNKLPICLRNADFSLQHGQIPRKNCHDLIDLPLCREIDDVSKRIAGESCVYECKDLHLSSIQDMPNYGHNYYKKTTENGEEIGCIRFCDDPIRSYGKDIELKIENKECTKRMCHQYIEYEDDFNSNNCRKVLCNLLYKDEISYKEKNDTLVFRKELAKFDLCQNELESYKEINKGKTVISTKDKIKCYDFGSDKLPFIKKWLEYDPEICELHSCYISQTKQRFLLKNNILKTFNDYCPFRGEINDLVQRCGKKQQYSIDNNCKDKEAYLEEYVLNILGIDEIILEEYTAKLENKCKECKEAKCISDDDCFEKCLQCYTKGSEVKDDEDIKNFYRQWAVYEKLGMSCDNNANNNNYFYNYCHGSEPKNFYIINEEFIKTYGGKEKESCKGESVKIKEFCENLKDINKNIPGDDCGCYSLGLMCDENKGECSLNIDNNLFKEIVYTADKICDVEFNEKFDCNGNTYDKKDILNGDIDFCFIYKPYEYKSRNIFKCKIFINK
jgi:hypothetical protein